MFVSKFIFVQECKQFVNVNVSLGEVYHNRENPLIKKPIEALENRV